MQHDTVLQFRASALCIYFFNFSTDLGSVIQSKNNLQEGSMQLVVKRRLLNQSLLLFLYVSGEIPVNLETTMHMSTIKNFSQPFN